MGFSGVREFATEQETVGKEWMSYFHKTGSPALTAAGFWADLSMAAGTPKYNAYVGTQAEGTPFVGSGNFGIYVPTPGSGETLHIADLNIGTPSATFAPATFLLCDYLYAYPLMDMDSTDVQAMDNSVAPVPRYADGKGVRAMIVTTTPQTASARVNVSYTNDQGVAGQVSTVYTNTSNVGMIQGGYASGGAASTQGPFVPLASGDQGMRQIDSIQLLASAGGFAAVVLVRPIAEIKIRERDTVAEISYLINKRALPKVLNGAYLNFIFQSGATAISSVIRGFVRFAWS